MVLFSIHPSYTVIKCLRGINGVLTVSAVILSVTEDSQTLGDSLKVQIKAENYHSCDWLCLVDWIRISTKANMHL